jgi:heme o synthase
MTEAALSLTFDARFGRAVRMLLDLTKFPISLASTLSAATGYYLWTRAPEWRVVPTSLGFLLIAMGSCALNQFQDRAIDAQMKRTRRRPIPSGAMQPASAVVIGVVLMLGGSSVLWLAGSFTAAAIALAGVAWYNGAYTYLKRVSAFAVVPGALIGALPPAIGWTAAGGHPLEPRILALCLFFFLWQVPHFWLLIVVFGRDYRDAGLPTLTETFSTRQLAGLIFTWILTTCASSLLLPVFGLTRSWWVSTGLLAAAAGLAWRSSRLLKDAPALPLFQSTFGAVNFYAIVVMALLFTDRPQF